MRTQSILLSGAAIGALIALSCGLPADAATTKHHKAAPAVSKTQAEIEELEAKVQFLTERLDQQAAVSRDEAAQLQAAQAAVAQAKASAAAAVATANADNASIQTIPTQVSTAVAAVKPKTDKIYYKGITITMGGFAAAESVYRQHDETADIGSSYSKLPFPNDPASRTGETHLTGRQSRYSLLAEGDVNASTRASFYGEFDFLGAAQTANSNESNSYQPRIRNLYGSVDWNDSGWHLLAGQSWSLVTMNAKGISPRNEVIPPTIEAQYVPGFVWARQPQMRLTKDFDDHQIWVAVSAENPQTTLGATKVASGVTVSNPSSAGLGALTQAPTSQYYSGTNYSLNQYPDVVGKIAFEPKIANHTLHVEAFGIGRNLYDRVAYAAGNAVGAAAGSTNASTWTGGYGGGATFDLVPRLLDVQASGMAGNGIGRYGSAQLPDAALQPNGTLVGLPETMYMAGATLHPMPQLDVYLFGGEEQQTSKTYQIGTTIYGNGNGAVANLSGCAIEGGSCSPETKAISQITGGFWDRLYQGSFGRVQFGIQYSYTQRQAFADANGLGPKATENMLFTSFRYYPF